MHGFGLAFFDIVNLADAHRVRLVAVSVIGHAARKTGDLERRGEVRAGSLHFPCKCSESRITTSRHAVLLQRNIRRG
jgi:hypothetical protein